MLLKPWSDAENEAALPVVSAKCTGKRSGIGDVRRCINVVQKMREPMTGQA